MEKDETNMHSLESLEKKQDKNLIKKNTEIYYCFQGNI